MTIIGRQWSPVLNTIVCSYFTNYRSLGITPVFTLKVYHEKIFRGVKFSLKYIGANDFFLRFGFGAPLAEKNGDLRERETSNSSDRYAASCPRMLKPLVYTG